MDLPRAYKCDLRRAVKRDLYLSHAVHRIKKYGTGRVQSKRSFFLTAAKRFPIFSFWRYVLSFSAYSTNWYELPVITTAS